MKLELVRKLCFLIKTKKSQTDSPVMKFQSKQDPSQLGEIRNGETPATEHSRVTPVA